MSSLIYKEEVFAIVGAAMEVYNALGPGFLEAVYQESLELELADRSIPFVAQQPLQIWYKSRYLKQTYVPDLLVLNKIVVELKALDHLTSREEAQLLNYLRATGMAAGLLINFGAEHKLEWKRMVLTRKRSANLR